MLYSNHIYRDNFINNKCKQELHYETKDMIGAK